MLKVVELAEIESVSRQIAQNFHPERIILFGSYARHEATPSSDVDMLVVMPLTVRGVEKSVEILRTIQPSFALDVLVRTPEQLRDRVAAGDFFLREVLEQGQVLYESAHA